MLLAFDLLELDGTDLRDLPLIERKRRLRRLLARRDDGLQFVDHLEGDGDEIFDCACRLGLEGTVSKRADPVCRAGPSLKIKNGAHPSIARVAEALRARA
jgi:bifunctional non-homologous end joining protein LigD